MFGVTDTVFRQRTRGSPSGLLKAKQILEFSLKIMSMHILRSRKLLQRVCPRFSCILTLRLGCSLQAPPLLSLTVKLSELHACRWNFSLPILSVVLGSSVSTLTGWPCSFLKSFMVSYLVNIHYISYSTVVCWWAFKWFSLFFFSFFFCATLQLVSFPNTSYLKCGNKIHFYFSGHFYSSTVIFLPCFLHLASTSCRLWVFHQHLNY